MEQEIHQNQKNFRILLQAMSRPGKVFCLETVGAEDPKSSAMALAESLLDHEVSACAFGCGDAEAFQAELVARTGVQTAGIEAADYIFILEACSRGAARHAKRGRAEFPDEGATLIYCIDNSSHVNPAQGRIRLSGPGIAETEGIFPEMEGIPPEEFMNLREMNTDYPLGVDAVFVGKDSKLMCLPRSVRIHRR